MEIRHTFFNKNKFICEISPNILYQYVLLVLWFVMVFAIMISIVGLLLNLLGHIITVICFMREGNPAREIYRILTLRECEYLDFIRRKSIPKYGDILRKLRYARSDLKNTGKSFDANKRLLKANGAVGGGGPGSGATTLQRVTPNAPPPPIRSTEPANLSLDRK